MGDVIKFKKGVIAKLTTKLMLAEPCFVTDENRLYIGGTIANIPMATKAEVDLINALPTSCTTVTRPTGKPVGYHIFDSTLGIPIWYNGTVWKNSVGATV